MCKSAEELPQFLPLPQFSVPVPTVFVEIDLILQFCTDPNSKPPPPESKLGGLAKLESKLELLFHSCCCPVPAQRYVAVLFARARRYCCYHIVVGILLWLNPRISLNLLSPLAGVTFLSVDRLSGNCHSHRSCFPTKVVVPSVSFPWSGSNKTNSGGSPIDTGLPMPPLGKLVGNGRIVSKYLSLANLVPRAYW